MRGVTGHGAKCGQRQMSWGRAPGESLEPRRRQPSLKGDMAILVMQFCIQKM